MRLSKTYLIGTITIIMLVLIVTMAQAQTVALEYRGERSTFTIYEIADAIYWAENSKTYPYGIVSVSCEGLADC